MKPVSVVIIPPHCVFMVRKLLVVMEQQSTFQAQSAAMELPITAVRTWNVAVSRVSHYFSTKLLVNSSFIFLALFPIEHQ